MSAVVGTERRGGPYLDDFAPGMVYRSRLGRTITEADNVWFTCLTLNTNQSHFNSVYAAGTEFERPLVNSTFTLALVTGLSVPDTSENAVANLGWDEVKLPSPVFVGDTIWAESEVLAVRESRSRPDTGIVTLRTRGINQDGKVVLELRRAFMITRHAAAAADVFPNSEEPWLT